MKLLQWIKILGPGLLYAATAVGVSHLVQSTRAGAIFNYDLILFVVLFNVLKYPFFKLGVLYAHYEKTSLVEGYNKYSKGAWWIFVIQSVLTMFVVIALIAKVSAGILPPLWAYFFKTSSLNIIGVQYGLLFLGGVLLFLGGLKMLNKLIKWVIVLLSLSVITAVALTLGNDGDAIAKVAFDFNNLDHLGFLIALGGWMPAPMDVSIWQSVWIAESKEKKRSEWMMDFNIGYWLTMFLAICFLILGAHTFKGNAMDLPNGAVGFANSFLGMFEHLYGAIGFVLIGIAALLTMFSTFMSVLDAYPRALSHAFDAQNAKRRDKYYKGLLLITIIGVVAILLSEINFAMLIDGVTVVSFLLVPVLAGANWWVAKKAQKEHQRWSFQKWELWSQWIGLVLLSAFSVLYLIFRL